MGNDEKSLNRQIAEALHGELHYETHGGTVYFWRVGKDALNEAAYDSLEDYEHSLDAIILELPVGVPVEFRFDTWTDADGVTWERCFLEIQPYSFAGLGQTRNEAAARAFLQRAEYVLAQRKDGA